MSIFTIIMSSLGFAFDLAITFWVFKCLLSDDKKLSDETTNFITKAFLLSLAAYWTLFALVFIGYAAYKGTGN